MSAKTIVVLLLIFAGSAQGTGETEQLSALNLKSESTALSWSLSCTALPILAGVGLLTHSENDVLEVTGGVLIASGVLLGPGAGYVYAGRPSRIWIPLALRTTGIFLLGATMQCETRHGAGIEEDCRMGVVSGLGLMLYLGSTLHDFIKVGAAVQNYNSSLSGSRITLMPHVDFSQRQMMVVASFSF